MTLPIVSDWTHLWEASGKCLSAGYYGTLPAINWWESPPEPAPFRGDLDLYVILESDSARTRSFALEILEEVARRARAVPSGVQISSAYVHGPYKPEYRSRRHLFLHGIFDDSSGLQFACPLVRWYSRHGATTTVAEPLSRLVPPVHVGPAEVLDGTLGVKHLRRRMRECSYRYLILDRNGRKTTMHKKLGVFQRLEFSIYAAEMATRNALRLENPDGADSGSWAELGRVRWPKAAEDLEALLELKRGIRLGTLSRNAAVRAQAASYDHATVILDEIQFDLENQC